MKPKTDNLVSRWNVFVWIALAASLVLLVPLVAMQFTNEVNWGVLDFVVMGFLLLCTGSLFVLLSRRSSRKRQVVIGVLLAAAFLCIWAELAVGVFTNLGT